jgi:hypothetical protein
VHDPPLAARTVVAVQGVVPTVVSVNTPGPEVFTIWGAAVMVRGDAPLFVTVIVAFLMPRPLVVRFPTGAEMAATACTTVPDRLTMYEATVPLEWIVKLPVRKVLPVVGLFTVGVKFTTIVQAPFGSIVWPAQVSFPAATPFVKLVLPVTVSVVKVSAPFPELVTVTV